MGPRLHRVRRSIAERGVLAVAAIRLVPIAPFTLVNLVAGASKIPFVDYLFGTIIGMAPGLILMSALGHQLWSIVSEPTLTNISAFHFGSARLAHRFDRRAGSAAALEETQHLKRTGTTVRVMTWNIHSGVGTDGHFDLTRVVETIARHQPDVVALRRSIPADARAGARLAFAVLAMPLVGTASRRNRLSWYRRRLTARWW